MDVIQKQDRSTITDKPKVRRTRDHKKEGEVALKLVKLTADISSALPTTGKKLESKKLKKKLQDVAEKNENLAKAISCKNQEIAELKRSVRSLNDVLNSVPIDELRCNSSIAGSKILELSKKNRQLRAELETTKNRVNKKELQIQKMERELKIAQDKFRQDADFMRKGNSTPCDDLQNKLNCMQQKLFESRNKNVELQNQLKMAQKCLQQEVGEHFNLNVLLASAAHSTWRGRAQQIIHLQQRVHELKERLEMFERQLPENRLTGGQSQDMPHEVTFITKPGSSSCRSPRKGALMLLPRSSSPTTLPGSSTFDRFTPGVRKSEILHRAKVDELQSEISTMKLQLEEQRSKILALKVRNKTLNDEVLKHKVKACTLAEQTDFNGINLATMNDKLSQQKYQFEQRIEEICREMAMVVRKREEAEYREEEMRNKLENIEELLNSKDEFIDELHEAIRRLETDLKAVCGGYLFSCRELRKEEFIAILDSLEAEKNMLTDHNKTLNERVETERTKNENLNEQLVKQKTRISRLEAKIRDLEKELDVQTERKKRSQRIAEYTSTISSTSLNSFVFENSSTLNKLAAAGAQNTNDETPKPNAEELKNQLEYATEKINLLNEKIATITMEREHDAKTFTEIVARTKTIILDTIMAEKSFSRLGSTVDGESVMNAP